MHPLEFAITLEAMDEAETWEFIEHCQMVYGANLTVAEADALLARLLWLYELISRRPPSTIDVEAR